MAVKQTRWYESLSIRLLAIFWLLILLTAIAAFTTVMNLTKPPGAERISDDFYRALNPILSDNATDGMVQPGRLIVGQYRIIAVHYHESDDIVYVPGLSQFEIGAALQLLNANTPMKFVVGDTTFGGPFPSNQGDVVVSRPTTSAELQALAEVGYGTRWWLYLIAFALVSSAIGVLILGYFFVRPLHHLRAATREIAAGVAYPDLKRLPRRHDELGELARTMASGAIELANSRDAQRRLLSDVSHELRSPLARLQVALELMETAALKSNRNFQQLHKDIYRLGAIIDSILWLSRLENGLEKLVKDPVDIAELLHDLRADLYYLQYDKNEKSWNERLILPANDLPLLPSDAVLLRLIIENLVRNGFQYGPENGKVYVHANTAENNFILTVRDEGPGVPAEKAARMFEPFYRADPSRHHGAGVGLGLALCQRAVIVLGGSIVAENHPQGGLQVSVTLPLA